VRKHHVKIGVALALAAVAALVISTAGSARSSAGFKMAIVTDIGSLQDRSFNQLANQGRLAVQGELRIPTRV
jgi:basic membrane protein A